MADEIARLEAQLATANHDNERTHTLLALANELVVRDSRRAIALATEAQQLAAPDPAASPRDSESYAQALIILARCHGHLAQYDQALTHILQAIAVVEKHDLVTQRARAYLIAGLIHEHMAGYAEALQFFLRALETAPDNDDWFLEAQARTHIGIVLFEGTGDTQKALDNFHKALAIYREHDNRKGQANVLTSIGFLYFRTGDYAAAIRESDKALAISHAISAHDLTIAILDTLASAYRKQARYPQAVEFARQCLTLAREIGDRYHEILSQRNIGKIHQQQGRHEEAEQQLCHALKLAQEVNTRQEQFKCHHDLAEIYTEAGRYQEALYHYQQFHTIKERLFNEKSDARLRNLEVIHQVETAQKEAEIYQLRNVALEQEINERRKVAQALRRQNEELDAFAHTVAHDLHNPLAVVIGLADNLTTSWTAVPPAQRQQHVQVIRDTGRRAAKIVDELLLLASVRKEEVERESLDMAAIVQQVLDDLELLRQKFQAEIRLPDRWPLALGHEPWVTQVWTNYLSNAFKYGGQPPLIQLGADPEADGLIRFWVQDNGPGMDAEARKKLFTDFTRLDHIRADGHGLGLAIVRRIVEKLGGQIGVESTPGTGSLFYFTLPTFRPEDR